MEKNGKRPRVLVSACLLGQAVRYDGGRRRHAWLVEELLPRIEPVAACPEVGIGLGVPRPPIQLVSIGKEVRALGVEDASLDVTQALEDYGYRWRQERLDGAILKARSPSCGLGTTPFFDADGCELGLTSGLFAQTLLDVLPPERCIDEQGLDDPARRDAWLAALFTDRPWNE